LILVDLSFPVDAINIGGPVQDGFFFIAWLRRTPEIENIPVMIISGTEPAKYQERIADFGIKACLHKPLNKEELLKAVQSVLGGGAATGQPEQS
jgi:CheY-like chemotaxis protein